MMRLNMGIMAMICHFPDLPRSCSRLVLIAKLIHTYTGIAGKMLIYATTDMICEGEPQVSWESTYCR